MSPFWAVLNHAHWVEWLWNRRVQYWAIHSSVRSFTRTAHSFVFYALLASLARSTALLRSLAHSLAPELMGWYEFWCPISKLFWTMVHWLHWPWPQNSEQRKWREKKNLVSERAKENAPNKNLVWIEAKPVARNECMASSSFYPIFL